VVFVGRVSSLSHSGLLRRQTLVQNGIVTFSYSLFRCFRTNVRFGRLKGLLASLQFQIIWQQRAAPQSSTNWKEAVFFLDAAAFSFSASGKHTNKIA
jgi:hypothetical protein